jgi:hypothetical protein
MSRAILLLVWALIAGGGAVMAIPLLPPDELSLDVDATIRECAELYRNGGAVTYAARIDRPPGELRFPIGRTNRKMDEGFRAACSVGKPLRIHYGVSAASVQEILWIRGIEGLDGTTYFTVADTHSVEGRYDSLYSVGFGLFLWLLAWLFYKGAKSRSL